MAFKVKERARVGGYARRRAAGGKKKGAIFACVSVALAAATGPSAKWQS